MHSASSPRTKSLTSGLPQSLASGLKGTAVPYGEGVGAAKDGMKASCYIRGRSGGLGSAAASLGVTHFPGKLSPREPMC